MSGESTRVGIIGAGPAGLLLSHHRTAIEDGDWRLAELDYITGSRAGSTSPAENYVGLPVEEPAAR